MKIFGKRSNESNSQNAVPGVFALLQQTHAIAKQERILLAGYAAWIIMPALATFGADFLSLSSFWERILASSILVANILLGTWVGACLTLVAMSRLRQEPIEEPEISTRARKAMPVLLYLFALSLFCVIVGMYLLLLPGIVAFVWLAFVKVTALEKPGVSFSQALIHSRNASKGRFLCVLWRLFAGNITFGLAYFILFLLIFGGIFLISGSSPSDFFALDMSTMQLSTPPWARLLLVALSLPLLPYTAIYTAALYDALKTR